MKILKTFLLAMIYSGAMAASAQGNEWDSNAPVPTPPPAPAPLPLPWKVMECYAGVFRGDMQVGRVAGRSRPFQAGGGAVYRTQARHEAVENAYATCMSMYGRSCQPQNFGCIAIKI